MKAWAVTSLPGSGVIVFCDHVSTARKLGAGVLGYSYKSVVAKRDRVWDRYYGKRITPRDLLNHDWWISCQRCKDICIPDNPDVVISKNRVFCRPECVTESCDPFPLDKFIINNNETSEEPCPFCGSNNAGPHFQTMTCLSKTALRMLRNASINEGMRVCPEGWVPDEYFVHDVRGKTIASTLRVEK
jgi:hypothetical protein